MKYEDYNTYVSSYLNMQSSFFLDAKLDRESSVICGQIKEPSVLEIVLNSTYITIMVQSITDNLGVDSDGNVDLKSVGMMYS